MEQNDPNLYSPGTTIHYSVPFDGVVTIKVYDDLGREVATLLDGEPDEAGEHDLSFAGTKLASGVYYYRVSGRGKDTHGSEQSFMDIKKIMVIKE